MYRGGRKESERQGREGKEGERGTGRERGGQLLTISSLYGRINFQVLSQVDGLIQKQPHKLDNFPRP